MIGLRIFYNQKLHSSCVVIPPCGEVIPPLLRGARGDRSIIVHPNPPGAFGATPLTKGGSKAASLQKGFSLLELLMVVSILAIVLGTIIPNLKPLLEGTALKRTTTLLADILRYARSSAIQHSQQTKITFDQESGDILYTVEADPFLSPGVFQEQAVPVQTPDTLGDLVQIASIQKNTLSGSQEPNVIEFNNDGSTSDTFIYLTDNSQKVFTVGIVGLTGQVLVWEKSVESFYAE